MEKSEIRKNNIIKRNNLSKEVVRENSLTICEKLIKVLEKIHFKTIFCYISYGNEVITTDIINEMLNLDKVVCVPKIIGKKKMEAVQITNLSNLEKNSFGILEPSGGKVIDKKNIDVTILPGVAFDENLNRIGFGGGYYDKFLKNSNVVKIALCHDIQFVKQIEPAKHDIRLDMILSQKRTIGYLEKSKLRRL